MTDFKTFHQRTQP